MEFVLLSTSNVKMHSFTQACREQYPTCSLDFVKVEDDATRPEQPVGIDGTEQCAWIRVQTFLNNRADTHALKGKRILISVENGIYHDEREHRWYDICVVGCYNTKTQAYKSVISEMKVPIEDQHKQAYDEFASTYKEQITFGKYITEFSPEFKNLEPKIPHNNWMKTIAGIDRGDQIKKGIDEVLRTL